MIDAKNSLSNKYMTDFMKTGKADDPLIIMIGNKTKECTYGTLQQFFRDQEFRNENPDEEIQIIAIDEVLCILVSDYQYWHTEKRVAKLFGTKIPEKTTVTTNANFTIGIAFYENGEIAEEKYFTGSEKECVDWINKEYKIYAIKSFFKKDIVFKIDKDDWKSIDEYISEGRFKI